MKRYSFALFPLIVLIGCQSQEDQTTYSTQLPIHLKTGYGPFYPSSGILNPEHLNSPLWGKMYLPVRGMPKGWTNKTKSMIWLNAHQLVYQNYKLGKIAPANYQYLQQDWKWIPDTTMLSAKPIKCYLYVVSGFDESRGKWAVLVDTNNNLDLGDEKALYPEYIKPGTVLDRITDSQLIQYEIYQKGQIKRVQLPMVVKQMGDQFVYHFAQYGVASFQVEGQTYELFISSGFDRPDFEKTTIIEATSCLESGKIDPQKLVEIGEIIEIGGKKYTNKGIDLYHNWLELEGTTMASANNYSLQVGTQFQPFLANDFITGKPVSLASLKGRYVYIDFWGTWCKGCVQELPHLKQLYKEIDHQQVEFVSIACHDSAERLQQFLSKNPLGWPQVLSDETNQLVEHYQVSGFPTSVLVDSRGTIVARNLHGLALANKLKAIAKN